MEQVASSSVASIRARAQADAAEVLRKNWQAGLIPVNPIQIARNLGVSVFSAQLGDDTWGMLVGGPGGADIYLDRDQPRNRYRFSCAHEIGHFIDRQDELAAGQAVLDKRSNEGRGSSDEIYANEFAASLLLPEEDFVRAIDLMGANNFDLASLFEVSLDAITYRRKLLKV